MTRQDRSASRLSDLGRYVYGTTRLGDEKIAFDDRVKMARAAIEAGVWLHTSHQYGNALQVLRAAIDQDRTRVPRIMYKIGWGTIEQIREQIKLQLDALGLERMDLGQLCLGEPLASEFRTGGACYDGFRRLRDEGLVERFALECWPWSSQVGLDGLTGGWPRGVVDAYIFYLNPLQRFVSNELWDLIVSRNMPILALRTVGGGVVQQIRDNPKAPEYLRTRAAQAAPLFERSGCANWTEFCVRFVFGIQQVRTTIGATSRVANLSQFLDAARSPAPLPADIQGELLALQRRWSDEHDRHAKAWSM
jgi:aryl-alcohol dehydrogenase-like predicted oxidoreductase